MPTTEAVCFDALQEAKARLGESPSKNNTTIINRSTASISVQAVPWCSGQSCELLGLTTAVRIRSELYFSADSMHFQPLLHLAEAVSIPNCSLSNVISASKIGRIPQERLVVLLSRPQCQYTDSSIQ